MPAEQVSVLSKTIIVSKAFRGNRPSLCTEVCNPHVDTLVIGVFIFQTTCFRKSNISAESGGVRLSSSCKVRRRWFTRYSWTCALIPESCAAAAPSSPSPFHFFQPHSVLWFRGPTLFPPADTNPQRRGAMHSCPLTCGFAEAGPRSGHRVCLSLSDRPRFAAQQDDSPSSFPKVIFIAPDRLDRKWGLISFYLLLK